MTPGSRVPPFTRRAPISTTRVRPMFRQNCMKGPGMAMTVLARMSVSVISPLAPAKRRISYSVLERAFTTRMPVMFSRMIRTRVSSLVWTAANRGMPRAETVSTTRIRKGSITTRIMARPGSIRRVTASPPRSIMGARMQRAWSCCTEDWTL